MGQKGYSNIGAVVGATYPEQAAKLRKIMPNTYFLVPGYGVQGGTAKDVANCFNKDGLGAIVNSSRGIMCAYINKKYEEKEFAAAAREEAIRMRDEILNCII
jgi:orotidine-5'-phosphate decarboxylase